MTSDSIRKGYENVTSSGKNLRNGSDDHFISSLAHHLEEAHLHLYTALQLKGSKHMNSSMRRAIEQMDRNLKILLRHEAKRRGHEGVYD
jgi:type II secretory pathway component PulF